MIHVDATDLVPDYLIIRLTSVKKKNSTHMTVMYNQGRLYRYTTYAPMAYYQ